MDLLPNELVIKVFKFLKAEDQRSLSLTSKRFLHIYKYKAGLKFILYIRLKEVDNSGKFKWISTEGCSYPYKELTLDSGDTNDLPLRRAEDDSYLDLIQKPMPPGGECVKIERLTIKGYDMEVDELQLLSRHFPNMTSVTLQNSCIRPSFGRVNSSLSDDSDDDECEDEGEVEVVVDGNKSTRGASSVKYLYITGLRHSGYESVIYRALTVYPELQEIEYFSSLIGSMHMRKKSDSVYQLYPKGHWLSLKNQSSCTPSREKTYTFNNRHILGFRSTNCNGGRNVIMGLPS